MPNRRQFAAPTLVLSSVLLLGSVVQANEYSFEYEVEGGYEYNDNVRLVPEDELEISGGWLSIPVTLGTRSERLDASLSGEMLFSRYDEDAWDSDDQELRGDASYQFERGDVDGYARYRRDSTRTSEFLDTGVTGLEARRRETASIGGSGNHMFTENNGIIGGLDFDDVDYDTSVLQDYQYLSGYAGWLHQWSARTQVTLQAYGSTFENDANSGFDTEVDTETIGARFGFDSTLSESFSTSLLIGWANIDTEYSSDLLDPPADDESNMLLLSGSLTYRGERQRVRATIESAPRPSGSGTVVENHAVGLDYTYQMTERSNFEVEFDAGQRGAVDDSFDLDRDYARVRFGLDYRFSESWYVAGSYQYAWQDQERAEDSADSNSILLSVIFRPTKSVWSR
ncbi:hypothetical protein F0M18_12905 [Pseudohalioglobus sediminis]|uniref:Beta-barrel porin 2 n=1 Tax=Pseudohalioglobus sediminis TaxID=2606449 RepID=A0A5B0WU08_9GAMM|nr:hypothetical protein [Pseudohalioglobus sediminis]KAA1189968.1 hypothetical protein F0M18_12905 [Pseudohalioglobus sediminis]